MGMDLSHFKNFLYNCHNCGLDLRNDAGGWYTGTVDKPIYNCPEDQFGMHLPRRVDGTLEHPTEENETVIKMWGP